MRRQNPVNGIEHNSRKGKTLSSLFTATTVILQALRLSLLSLFYYFIILKTFTCIGSVKYMYFTPTLCTRNLTNRPYISGLSNSSLDTYWRETISLKKVVLGGRVPGKRSWGKRGWDGKIASTRGLDRGLDTPWIRGTQRQFSEEYLFGRRFEI